MHPAAYNWTFQSFHGWRNDKSNLTVLEIGSFDINGSIKKIFEPFAAEYIGIDPQDGPNVDVVADGETYFHEGYFDVVVSCEVFEHAPGWKNIVSNAYRNLKEGGVFIATMAGEGRAPHSAVHGNAPYQWEHYANIGEWDLRQTLMKCGFVNIETNYVGKDHHPDLRCKASK